MALASSSQENTNNPYYFKHINSDAYVDKYPMTYNIYIYIYTVLLCI